MIGTLHPSGLFAGEAGGKGSIINLLSRQQFRMHFSVICARLVVQSNMSMSSGLNRNAIRLRVPIFLD